MKLELKDAERVEGVLEMDIYRRGELIEHVVEYNIVVEGERDWRN